MIVLKRETDVENIISICKEENVEYADNVGVFVARDRDEILGYSLFFVGQSLAIKNVKTPLVLWKSIGDGLFRATINFAIENGISTATMEQSLLEKLTGDIIPEDKATAVVEDCEKFLEEIKRCKR